jgi:hypothetical protein
MEKKKAKAIKGKTEKKICEKSPYYVNVINKEEKCLVNTSKEEDISM